MANNHEVVLFIISLFIINLFSNNLVESAIQPNSTAEMQPKESYTDKKTFQSENEIEKEIQEAVEKEMKEEMDKINGEVAKFTKDLTRKRKKNKRKQIRSGGFMEIIQFSGPGSGPFHTIHRRGVFNSTDGNQTETDPAEEIMNELNNIMNPFAGGHAQGKRKKKAKNLARNKVLPAFHAINGIDSMIESFLTGMLGEMFNGAGDVEVIQVMPMRPTFTVHVLDENQMFHGQRVNRNNNSNSNLTNDELELDNIQLDINEGERHGSVEVKSFKHHEDNETEKYSSDPRAEVNEAYHDEERRHESPEAVKQKIKEAIKESLGETHKKEVNPGTNQEPHHETNTKDYFHNKVTKNPTYTKPVVNKHGVVAQQKAFDDSFNNKTKRKQQTNQTQEVKKVHWFIKLLKFVFYIFLLGIILLIVKFLYIIFSDTKTMGYTEATSSTDETNPESELQQTKNKGEKQK